MEVICLEDRAFYSLVEEVYQRLKEKEQKVEDGWISAVEAKQKLRISSKTTLQKLRDEGKIRFSQPEKKHIVYDVLSGQKRDISTAALVRMNMVLHNSPTEIIR